MSFFHCGSLFIVAHFSLWLTWINAYILFQERSVFNCLNIKFFYKISLRQVFFFEFILNHQYIALEQGLRVFKQIKKWIKILPDRYLIGNSEGVDSRFIIYLNKQTWKERNIISLFTKYICQNFKQNSFILRSVL